MVDLDQSRSEPPATPASPKPAATEPADLRRSGPAAPPPASPKTGASQRQLQRLNALIVRHACATLLLEAALRRERDPAAVHAYRETIARHEQRLSQLQHAVQRHGGAPARIGPWRRAWCRLRIIAASLRGRPRLVALLHAQHAL